MQQLLELMRGAIAQIVREEVEKALSESREHVSEYLSTREAADLAGVSAGTLRRWRREERLQGGKAGSRLRWLRSDLEKLLREDGKRLAPRAIPKTQVRVKSPEEQVAELLHA